MEPLSASGSRLLTALAIFCVLLLGGAFLMSWISHQSWYTEFIYGAIVALLVGVGFLTRA